MYSINGLSDFVNPQYVAQGGLPRVPLAADAVLPAGSSYTTGLGDVTNWSQWGQDMLQQGIKDTTGAITYLANRSGATRPQTSTTTPAATTPTPQDASLLPVTTPPLVKKGVPGWAWALIAVGGLAVVGGGAYFLFFRKG